MTTIDSKIEFLPDNINIVNEDGDVVAIDREFDDSPNTNGAEYDEPLEAYRSPNFYDVQETIEASIQKSHENGYRSIKIGSKPLGQYLAIDVFKALPNDEAKIIVDKYKDRASEVLGSQETSRRAIGMRVVEFAAHATTPDVRMLAANDDTLKD